MDYWHVSHYDLIRYALADANNTQIKIHNPAGSVSGFLTNDERNHVSFTDMEKAEYFILHSRMDYADRVAPHGFEELMAITVDGMKISTLYKRVPAADINDNS